MRQNLVNTAVTTATAATALLSLSAILALSTAAGAQTPNTYKITNLGLPATGATGSGATDINDSGLVIGSTTKTVRGVTSIYYGFVWENGRFTTLASAGGRNYTTPTGIDLAGNVVGYSNNDGPPSDTYIIPTYWRRAAGYVPRSFNTLLPSGSPWTLLSMGGVSPSGQYVVARASNSVTGYYGSVLCKLTGDGSAILFVTPLGYGSGGPGSASSVNDSGQVARLVPTAELSTSGVNILRGYRITPQDTDSDGLPDIWYVPGGGYPFENLLMEDLGTLGGKAMGWVPAINALGQMAGYSETSAGVRHPFLWTGATETMPATLFDLGLLPTSSYGGANALNNSGVVVGDGGPFVWDSIRGMRNLNLIKTANDTSGLNLTSPKGISSSGRIVGTGMLTKGKLSQESYRAFIAIPQW